MECTFYEVSISEGYNEVHDLFKEILKRVLVHRNTPDKRDTLRIPTLGIKRSPSFERRKRASSYEKEPKDSPETQRKEFSETPLKLSKSIRDLNEENTSKNKFMSKSSPISQRKRSPFFVEKGKNPVDKLEEESKTNQTTNLQRVKSGNPAEEGDQTCGHESTDINNNERQKESTEKPKGPFTLNKSTNDRPTTSFGRMRFGLERTFGRKKTVYNL